MSYHIAKRRKLDLEHASEIVISDEKPLQELEKKSSEGEIEKLDALLQKFESIREENQKKSEEVQSCGGRNVNSSEAIEELKEASTEEKPDVKELQEDLTQKTTEETESVDQPGQDLPGSSETNDCQNEIGKIVLQEKLDPPKQMLLQEPVPVCEANEIVESSEENSNSDCSGPNVYKSELNEELQHVSTGENVDEDFDQPDEDLPNESTQDDESVSKENERENLMRGKGEEEIDPVLKLIDCPKKIFLQKFGSICDENRNNFESEEIQSCGGPNVNSFETIEELKEDSTKQNPDGKELQDFTQLIEEAEPVDQTDLPKEIFVQSATIDCQNESGNIVLSIEELEERMNEKKIAEDLIQADEIVVQDNEENSSSAHTDELSKKTEEYEKSEPNLALINEILKHPMASQWQSTSHQPYVLNEVAANTDEYLRVKETFLSTDNRNQVIRIERVENPFLLGHYLLKKEKMGQTNSFVEERTLYHGTSEENIDGICELNFDWRRTKTHKFGKGVSFAKEVSWADHYAPENVMIMAKVLVSRSIEGNRGTVYPPSGYDTTQNAAGRVLVKYEDDDFFPQYVIHYGKRVFIRWDYFEDSDDDDF